jgi:N-acetyl-gamma-glutamyl-phosphate reductase
MTYDISTSLKASVVGATGYLGGEVIRLILNHPTLSISHLTSNSSAGMPIHTFHPSLRGVTDASFVEYDPEAVARDSDVVFCAVPHGAAMGVVSELLELNNAIKVVDLSADYRIGDVATYEAWYKVQHTAPGLLKEAVYGIPELYEAEIATARIVANPGCYPTSAILGLAPLLSSGAIDPYSIILDSKSGVSGAGRGLSQITHYPECNESIKAYAVGTHRHTPEIEQEFSKLSGTGVVISFTPHLTPMNRGILTTAYCSLAAGADPESLHGMYESFYESAPFVRVLEQGVLPETRSVRGTNFCDVQVTYDKRTGRVVVISAIDNMVKGGAGQAIQNCNLLFGLPQETGLMATGVYI